jgi:intracellular sulfur oxidation DsrE/DsrF family protein
MHRFLLFLLPLTLPASHLSAQDDQPAKGPVIAGYGAVYDIPDPDFPADPRQMYLVVFDIADSPVAPSEVNPLINTLARFLNMHARAGVPRENMRVAAVLHGGAAKDALTDAAYRQRYNGDNPNAPLLRQLVDAGVDVYICGQSARGRGFARDELAEPVQVALSAMTVLVTLQGEGYRMIRF